MLTELRIENFAIIDHLELTFGAGLNVITGETGAGKSIIIDAVELLLGGKADPAFIRAGAERAIVEGVFRLDERARALIVPVLQREDLLEGDSATEITIGREIRSNGRSAARINGVSVNLEVLSEIGGLLVDVHGQSAHLSLLKPGSHIDLLDRYANVMDARAALASVVGRLTDVRAEIDRLEQDEAVLQRRAQRLRDEIEEIESAALRPGEDEELRAERNRLANSEQLARLSGEIVQLLQGDDRGEGVSALDAVLQATGLFAKLVAIDPDLKEEHAAAIEIGDMLDDLADSMSRYLETVEYNPTRLDEVEERLETINSLKRRFGSSIELILEHAEQARAELDGIEHSEERITALREEADRLLHHVGELAERISRARHAAASRLSEGIVRELADLRMQKARFEVSIAQSDDPDGCYVGERRLAFDATGIDTVEFMMSANPGEPLRPLVKVASGGEAARIMLALKRVLTQADQTPTLIFDEIDQGIGGRVGSVVGEKLWELTGEHQVMVVTHLAQLAGYADRHFRVEKLVENDRTRTRIIPLEEEAQRVEELAAMLGTINESGQQSARELLAAASAYKRAQHSGGAQGTPIQEGG
ncbi:MAG: DNA repair protein RecN [Candidatus Flexifilum sp.]|jgi:DNA repair protein RecN (Recombination protein N)